MSLNILVISADFNIYRALQDFLYPLFQGVIIKNTDVMKRALEFLSTQRPLFVFVDDNAQVQLDPILQITRYFKFTIVRVKPDGKFHKNPVKGWGADYTIPKPIHQAHLKEIIIDNLSGQTV